MAEKKKGSSGKKRTVDKWKKKMWYTIHAPPEYESRVLGETFSEKPELLVGRRIRANAGELAAQSRKHHITLKFKINAVKGNKAETFVTGHEIKDSYFRRFVRRRNSKVQNTQQVKTRDGANVKIKAVTVTARKVERKKETDIRKIMEKEIGKFCSDKTYNRLTLDLVFGNFTGKLLGSIKKVAPVKRIEIVKTELIGELPGKATAEQ